MTSHLSRREVLSRGVAAGLVLSGLPTLLAACGASVVPKAETTFDRIKREKIARVGFGNNYPFSAVTADGLSGESVDVVRTVFAKAGVDKIEGVLTEFAALIPSLVAGRIDFIGDGMFVRPARCELIDFGDPEFQLGSGLAVKKGNPKGLTKLQDFIDKRAKIGLVTGGAEVEFSDIAGIPKDQQVLFPDGPTSIAGLQAGQVDAVMFTTLNVRDLVNKAGDPNIEYADMSEQPKDKDGAPAVGYGAIGFRLEDDDLRNFYNAELAMLKSRGELLKIMAPYGFTESEMTDKKATDICPNISG
jgi:polar amino acid transport system substrate-binding protein